ncbi:GerAB/ArcD/ProY family transporter [Neobacillus mesonae]|uniref:Spore gernimation protein KC n=1 Tax=Neobacillus mesonae TaxID=1193713 RepID=A0A3Q9QSR0_9BACI|nr:endospore germination permease [Neobacillus mesonae]AZU61307.1 spore gernimation protein KC [Neobacillus mesonae]
MEKENISLSQLLTLLVNFLLGSAIVVGIGGNAKNDAWIAICIAALLGIGIMMFYHYMMARLPESNWFQLLEFCFGRKISIVFSFLYVVYFLYITSRVVRDFGELITSAIMPHTPIEVISVTFSLLMGYVVYLGLEVLARTSEIFTPYLMIFFILLTIFLFVSGNTEFQQIQPILREGWNPILTTAFKDLAFFPYGELIAFTVILTYVTNKKYSMKVSLLGVAAASFLLIASALLMLMTLGVDSIVRSNFPLLSAARNVSIGNFIERIDALAVFIMMLGIFVKGSVFLFGGLKGLEYIFRLPFRYFAVPQSLIVSFFSVLLAIDFADSIQEGLGIVPYYLHLPFQFCIPCLVLVILIWKQRKSKSLK